MISRHLRSDLREWELETRGESPASIFHSFYSKINNQTIKYNTYIYRRPACNSSEESNIFERQLQTLIISSSIRIKYTLKTRPFSTYDDSLVYCSDAVLFFAGGRLPVLKPFPCSPSATRGGAI